MQDIYYINSQNQRLDLMDSPYYLQTGDFFDFEWAYETTVNKITSFNRDVTEKEMTMSVFGGTLSEFYTAMNNFHAVTEYDLLNMTSGKLYIGNQYVRCYIIASKKSEWEYDGGFADVDITFVVEYPFWITETRYGFAVQSVVSTDNKRYPYKYPYRYANGLTSGTVTNPHFANSGFKIIVYGTATNPEIIIGGNVYQVNAIINTGEYLVIDSVGTIIKYQIDGTQVNMFDYRNKTYDIFKKIPAGANAMSWSGDFAFDIIIFEERSEPKWIL